MTALEKIKAETARLEPDEQVELFRWWVASDTFKQRQLAALKREIAVGIEQLDQGRYQSYDAGNAMALAGEIGRSGRERLKLARKPPKA